MIRKYSREFYLFVLKNLNGTSVRELAQIVSKKFNIDVTYNQMKAYLSNNKLKTGATKGNAKGKSLLFLESEVEFIRANYVGISNSELADLVNKNFNKNFTRLQIKQYKNSNHLDSGLNGQFEKGHISANKGQKMSPEIYKKVQKTMFKKGNKPHNTVPVGTETISKDFYIKVKVAEPNKWKMKHIFLYEKAHNVAVKKNELVIFLDGNKRNFAVNNLFLITRQEHARLNKNKLRFNNPDLTKTGLNIVKL